MLRSLLGVKDDLELRGVIPNSFDHIFSHIARQENKQYLVRASYLEIYKEDVRDLLHKDRAKRLEIKEKPDTGVYVKVSSLQVNHNARQPSVAYECAFVNFNCQLAIH